RKGDMECLFKSVHFLSSVPIGTPFHPLLLLRRSGSRDCVFSGAGVLQPAIGGAGGLAGARPFNALHLPGAACNLILILACLQRAIFYHRGGLVSVENLVPAVEGFHEHARNFTVVSGNFSVLGKHTLFARRTTHFSL